MEAGECGELCLSFTASSIQMVRSSKSDFVIRLFQNTAEVCAQTHITTRDTFLAIIQPMEVSSYVNKMNYLLVHSDFF